MKRFYLKDNLREALRYCFLAAFWSMLCYALIYGTPALKKYESQRQMKKVEAAFRQVLPPFDNQPWQVKEQQDGYDFYVARSKKTDSAEAIAGFAFFYPPDAPRERRWLIGADSEGVLHGFLPWNHLESGRISEDFLLEAQQWFLKYYQALRFNLEIQA